MRSIIAMFVLILFFAVPAFRHAVFFNLLPLCITGIALLFLYHFIVGQTAARLLALIVLCAICFHAYNCYLFGVNFAFDGREYWSLAQGFASGKGLGGSMYRTPLYPAIAGLFAALGDHTGFFIVLFQHALLAACIPGIFAVGRLFGFSQKASCIAAAFLALNSLLMQAAGFIMTEIVFLVLALAGVASLKLLYDKPSLVLSVVSGAAFAAATYCRPLLFPVLIGGLFFLAMKRGKYGIYLGCIALAAYFGATAPWCLRNLSLSGRYAMSSGFGVQAFTKAVTFDCINRNGKYYKRIEIPLGNVLTDLSLIGFETPEVPEDRWQVNRIPHVLIDSLKAHHGFSYPQASALLGKTAVEGFLRHPLRYVSSVGASFATLLFEHRDMYPDVKYIVPVETAGMYKLFARLLRGAVYVSGYVFLLFPLALVFRGNKKGAPLMPFLAVIVMYGITAAVQIGFTRYTIPWEPLKALCAAYVVETLFRMKTLVPIKIGR